MNSDAQALSPEASPRPRAWVSNSPAFKGFSEVFRGFQELNFPRRFSRFTLNQSKSNQIRQNQGAPLKKDENSPFFGIKGALLALRLLLNPQIYSGLVIFITL